MSTLAIYIAFHGNAKEAFEYYHSVFGGELQLITYADMPEMKGMPFEPDPQAVAHAMLTLDGGTITGGDAMPGEQYHVKDTVYSMLYGLDDVEQAKGLMDRLAADGGTVNMAFEPSPWGSHYGQVFDKFGVMWAFDVEGDGN